MSDFVPRDILHELWDDILAHHWNYFDSEESVVKIENRKKLEECLKEFLCIVQHDRKFFLPETAEVLRKSIQDLEDFNAQKALTAFEAISQYANNLFTKPWRKEFRLLKMYSGFYQHEIKSNLLYAESLFEAMGYRRLSENLLILDGPICPDQVTNVSRDAMTAYIELQIMKEIYAALDAVGLTCSWQDIYRYREKYTGDPSQAIKALGYSIDERRFRSRQKAMLADNYGYIDAQQPSNYFATNIKSCPAQCQCNIYQQVPPVPRYRQFPQANALCSGPEHHQKSSINLVYNNMLYPAHFQQNQHSCGDFQLPQMSHSKSLEDYDESVHHPHNVFLHRHSLDHQQECAVHNQYLHLNQLQPKPQYHQTLNHPQQNYYESTYDCIDGNSLGGGSSTISYAAVSGNLGVAAAIAGSGSCGSAGITCATNAIAPPSHMYNVSGNRIALPLNISNQLSAYDNLQAMNSNGLQENAYASITDQRTYSSVTKSPQNCKINRTGYNQSSNIHGIPKPVLVNHSHQRQRSSQSEQLISFDGHITQQQLEPLAPYRQNCETSNHLVDKHYSIQNVMGNSISPTCQQYYLSGKGPANGDAYVYAKPTPKENRKPNVTNLLKNPHKSGEREDTTDISYESANDDYINRPYKESERNEPNSPTHFPNSIDGATSMEYCTYGSQNIEKNCCPKELGVGKDLLTQSLDLESLKIINDTLPGQINSTERRKSNYYEDERKNTTRQQQQHQQLEKKQKSKVFEKNIAGMGHSVNNMQNQKNSVDNNTRKIKSALKHTNATLKSNTNINSNTQLKSKDNNKSLSKTVNNNNIESSSNGTTQCKTSFAKKLPSPSSSTTSTNKPPVITQIIANSANEWSCSFCTFLNDETKRICEMCYRSKDFNFDASTTSTATGDTTVTHNMPTCV